MDVGQRLGHAPPAEPGCDDVGASVQHGLPARGRTHADEDLEQVRADVAAGDLAPGEPRPGAGPQREPVDPERAPVVAVEVEADDVPPSLERDEMVRELRPVLRDPFSLVFGLVQPPFFLALFGPLLVGSLGGTAVLGGDVWLWFVPVILVMTTLFGTSGTGRTSRSSSCPGRASACSSPRCPGRRSWWAAR
jgi:hypothetical protein